MSVATSVEMPASGRFQDLIGQQFGHLTVLAFAGMLGKRPRAHWLCRCDCPEKNEIVAAGGHLKKGAVQSCGCLLRARAIDLTGKQFGHWLVVKKGKRKRHWLCRCDCGKQTEREVYGSSLTDRVSLSCGCHRIENSKEMMRQMRAAGYGGRLSHGGAYTPEYKSWSHMKARCENPSEAGYENYGGRGIKVYDGWKESFANFLADVGLRPSPEYSLDRINVNGDYEPGNVRWATDEVQANNTRRKRLEQFSEIERGNSLTDEQIRIQMVRRGLKPE